MAESVKRRPYDASKRRETARLRRLGILQTARDLFLASGYPSTTVAEIAARAHVSEDLLFRLFGNKRGILKELMDVTVGGDDENVALLDREGPQTVRAATDQHEQIRLFAAGMTAQLDRMRPLNDLMRSAAAVEPEIATLQDDLHKRQRRFAMNTVASWIAANGPLRHHMSEDEAGAILWTLASPEVHRNVTQDCGWTSEQFQIWLEDILTAAVLP